MIHCSPYVLARGARAVSLRESFRSRELPVLGHLSFGVADLSRTAAFYDEAMTALGFRRVWTTDSTVGYGVEEGRDKLLLIRKPGPITPPSSGFHLAFDAPNRAAVDAFHAAAMAHGGTDQGAPGLRPHYGPAYYAAFVLDPDGYKLEAVFQSDEA